MRLGDTSSSSARRGRTLKTETGPPSYPFIETRRAAGLRIARPDLAACAAWRCALRSSTGRSHPGPGFGLGPGPACGGLSSAGRATESHSVGHRFDPDRLHQDLAVLRFGGAYRVFGLRASGATGSTSAFAAEPKMRGVRGLSSAGRASDLHSEGHRFDPDRLHQNARAGRPAGMGR
jgi:hypothetical protein